MEEYLATIDSYLAARNISPQSLGIYATGNAHVIERIRTGRASHNTIRRVLDYIDGHPPIQKGSA